MKITITSKQHINEVRWWLKKKHKKCHLLLIRRCKFPETRYPAPSFSFISSPFITRFSSDLRCFIPHACLFIFSAALLSNCYSRFFHSSRKRKMIMWDSGDFRGFSFSQSWTSNSFWNCVIVSQWFIDSRTLATFYLRFDFVSHLLDSRLKGTSWFILSDCNLLHESRSFNLRNENVFTCSSTFTRAMIKQRSWLN